MAVAGLSVCEGSGIVAPQLHLNEYSMLPSGTGCRKCPAKNECGLPNRGSRHDTLLLILVPSRQMRHPILRNRSHARIRSHAGCLRHLSLLATLPLSYTRALGPHRSTDSELCVRSWRAPRPADSGWLSTRFLLLQFGLQTEQRLQFI